MPSKGELTEQLKNQIAAAKAIAAKADDEARGYTPDERAALEQHMAAAKGLKARLDDFGVRDAIDALGAQIGGASGKAAPVHRSESRWVKDTIERVQKQQQATGAKALVTGSLDVAAPIDTEIVRMAEYPTRVLDLLVDRRAISGTNTFTFTRQTVRTDNAAPVADGAQKPVSVYTVAEVEDRVRVIAHLSENLPERLLADHADLGDYLEVEMERGLMTALEEQIVAGDGVGENLTGVLSTSGVLAQPFATDVVTTLRKARTAMAVQGETPTGWLLNPADTEAIDLLREGAEGAFLLAAPPGNITGNLPIVESTVVPAGTAVLADWRWARLIVRQDATLDVDRSGELFRTNQVQLRLEGRYGFAIRRTTAFCEVDLSAT